MARQLLTRLSDDRRATIPSDEYQMSFPMAIEKKLAEAWQAHLQTGTTHADA